jgi:hypothetical protein
MHIQFVIYCFKYICIHNAETFGHVTVFLPVELWNECGGPNDRVREDGLPLEHDGWGPAVPTPTVIFRLDKTKILPKKETFVVTFSYA